MPTYFSGSCCLNQFWMTARSRFAAQIQQVQLRQNTTTGLRHEREVYKQVLSDKSDLLLLRVRIELRHLHGRRLQELSHEVVVGQQLAEAPEHEFTVDRGVHVDDLDAGDGLVH
ncbi:hypothetical protein V7S43_010590 [Phytophthora oleae]|uniref:Uncharacterized protein n=1 Tax=Phytophthora oleae TaxID=2107226 RepID=A0ABD3FBH2_9STRA